MRSYDPRHGVNISKKKTTRYVENGIRREYQFNGSRFLKKEIYDIALNKFRNGHVVVYVGSDKNKENLTFRGSRIVIYSYNKTNEMH